MFGGWQQMLVPVPGLGWLQIGRMTQTDCANKFTQLKLCLKLGSGILFVPLFSPRSEFDTDLIRIFRPKIIQLVRLAGKIFPNRLSIADQLHQFSSLQSGAACQ